MNDIRGRCSRSVGWLAAATLFVAGWGCGDRHRPVSEQPPSQPAVARPNPDNLTFDAGRVIAGQVVTHDFAIDNLLDEPMVIRSDADIQLNCGCSGLLPEARRVEARSRTKIKVTVDTTGRSGRFAHGGTVTWTAPSGTKRTASLTLQGGAVPPLVCEPDLLRFEPRDIRDGTCKELVLRGNLGGG